MKILVVRFKQIGDAILSSVICKSLKESFPEAQIDYVLYEEVAPLFEGQDYISNVIKITKEEQKNVLKYVKKVWNVTREEYDIVIDIMSTPKSELFTLFSTGAKFKIGRKKEYRGYSYTHKIEEPNGGEDKPEKFLKMLEPLEKAGYNIKYDKNYSLSFKEEEIKNMREKMEKAGVDFNKILIPLAVTSRRPEKIYPIDLMKKLAEEILSKYDCQIILYYSPAEKERVLNFHKELNFDKRIISNITTKNIKELGIMLSQCDMFVGNEGGPRHLSQAVGIPTVSIFGPNSRKKDWLTQDNNRHKAVDIGDINEAELQKLSHEEKYRLMTTEKIMELVNEAMKHVEKYR